VQRRDKNVRGWSHALCPSLSLLAGRNATDICSSYRARKDADVLYSIVHLRRVRESRSLEPRGEASRLLLMGSTSGSGFLLDADRAGEARKPESS